MKASNLISVLLLTSIGLSVAAEASIAQNYYKVAGVGTAVKVYVPGQTPLTEYTKAITNAPKPRIMTFNGCGWGKFKESVSSPVSSFIRNGVALAIGTGAVPVCTRIPGVAATLTTPATPVTFTATNDAAIPTVRRTPDGFIYFKGADQQTTYTVQVGTNSTKKAKANQCGLVAMNFKTTDVLPILVVERP